MGFLKESIETTVTLNDSASKMIKLLYRVYFICCLLTVASIFSFEIYHGLFSITTLFNILILIQLLYLIYKADRVSNVALFFTFFIFIIFNFIGASVRGKATCVSFFFIHHIIAIFYLLGVRKQWKMVAVLVVEMLVLNAINYITDYSLFYNPIYTTEIQKKFFFLFSLNPLFLIISLLFVSWRNQKVILNLYRQKEKEYETEVEKKNKSVVDSEEFQDLNYLAENRSPSFYTKFCSTYPHFIESLKREEYNLNKSEKEICAYVFLNYTTKDIAKHTNSSLKSVESKKYRIRKKLNLSADLVLDSSTLKNL